MEDTNAESNLRDISDEMLKDVLDKVNEHYLELDREQKRRRREKLIFMERSRQIAQGYTLEHDRELGALRLFDLAIDYAESGAHWVEIAALIRAAMEVLDLDKRCTCDEGHAESTTDVEVDKGPDSFEPFGKALEKLINQYSIESGSGTPDFILAQYILELGRKLKSIADDQRNGAKQDE